MSRIPKIEIKSTTTSLAADLVFVSQDVGGKLAVPNKSAYKSLLQKLRQHGGVSGAPRVVELVASAGANGCEHVILAGLGKTQDLNSEQLRRLGACVVRKAYAAQVSSLRLEIQQFKALSGRGDSDAQLEAFLEGFLLGAYEFTKYKTAKKDEKRGDVRLVLVTDQSKAHYQRLLERLSAMSDAITVARDWSNEPPNVGYPQYYAAEALKWAKKLGIRARAFGEKEAAKEGMEMLLSVSKGSEREGQVVVLDYAPKGKKPQKTICLVGKGVTFDTGGISIKPSQSMEEMKHDMSGASTVFGALMMCARLKVPHRVVALMGFVENMPDGRATVPGTVVRSRSGKTVQIDNTDAEGRLVLGDLLDYANRFKPDVMIDAATLTGAVLVCLGNRASAVMSNDEGLAESLKRVGDVCGERLWQMPLYSEYLEDIRSDVADIRNISAGRNAGTCTAGKFLEQFVKPSVKWAHLDIAGTAWDLGHLEYHPKKGATGAYVRTLFRFIEEY